MTVGLLTADLSSVSVRQKALSDFSNEPSCASVNRGSAQLQGGVQRGDENTEHVKISSKRLVGVDIFNLQR